MHNTLHITNGDSAVSGLNEAGMLGDIIPWRDVLHIGPVKNYDSWQTFDQARIEFLIKSKLGEREFVEQSFADRMSVMNQIHQYDSIYLWFEHDLYDQLQLLQILTWVVTEVQIHNRIKLIVSDLYLGQATAANFHELFRYSEPLQAQHLSTAALYWQALTAETPLLLSTLKHSTVLPFMYPAFQRLCREYPSVSNGLNQVQTTILELLDQTTNGPELFVLYQNTEEAKFMGDSIFAQVLENLIHCKVPLIQFEQTNKNSHVWQDKLSITAVGIAILQSQSHYLNFNEINTWIGGVQLKTPSVWCYDKGSEQFEVCVCE